MEILVFGTLWFWLLAAGAVILIIWFLESALSSSKDTGGGFWSTTTILAFGTLYYFFGSKQDVIDILLFMKHHPIYTLLFVFGYFAIGVVWSIAKWYFFLHEKREKLIERSDDGKLSDYDRKSIPTARNNKSRITTWMSYWPFSALWTLIDEPVKKGFRYIYAEIEKLFEGMTNKMFSDEEIEKRLSSKKKASKK